MGRISYPFHIFFTLINTSFVFLLKINKLFLLKLWLLEGMINSILGVRIKGMLKTKL